MNQTKVSPMQILILSLLFILLICVGVLFYKVFTDEKTGPAGPAGPAGPKGERGPGGGDTGATGATGAQGVQGPPGATGATGAQGPPGAQGAKGIPGATGARGVQGPAGAQGPAGPPGAEGEPGPAGPRGIPGATGARGVQGPAGDPSECHASNCRSTLLLPERQEMVIPNWEGDVLLSITKPFIRDFSLRKRFNGKIPMSIPNIFILYCNENTRLNKKKSIPYINTDTTTT
jgi:hypothetical protein